MNDILSGILNVLLIALICIAAVFVVAVVITVIHEKRRKASGKKRRENSIWEDRKRNCFGLPWSFTKYALDDQRFYLERGFLSTRYDEVRLYRMTDVVLTRTLFQKIFGIGTLKIDSSDKSLGNFMIENIKDSEKTKELFSRKIEQERKANRVYTRESIGSDEDYDGDGIDDGEINS
ncbi:MAG: PH domain-containing protein [Lachnospiraceae bacterium]|nr:PH domain-containing protein [Lachnospiraceae bacterium]